MDVNPCAVSPVVGSLEGAKEHLQVITSFSCSTKGQDIQNMMISFLLRDDWILLSLQLSQPWTTSDYLMKQREEMANLKIHLLKAKRNYMVTQWWDPCSCFQHGMDLNDQRQAKILLKLSMCNHHRVCWRFYLPRGLPELSLSLKHHLVTSCSSC